MEGEFAGLIMSTELTELGWERNRPSLKTYNERSADRDYFGWHYILTTVDSAHCRHGQYRLYQWYTLYFLMT